MLGVNVGYIVRCICDEVALRIVIFGVALFGFGDLLYFILGKFVNIL